MIVDMLFSLGICCFLGSALTQLYKVLKTHKTSGISLKHYKLKMVAVSLMTAGYVLSNLPISLTISLIEGSITVILMGFIIKYRRQKND